MILNPKERTLFYERKYKKRYEELKKRVVDRKIEFENLINFMESETTWLTAPASTKYHLCKENGLLEHSLNVAESMLKIKKALNPSISEESCIIVALLHDLGKVGMPGNPQYLINESYSEQNSFGQNAGKPYLFNKSLTYLSVPVRSLYLASKYIDLSEEEVQAIIYHDGKYVEDNRSVATREMPLTLLLQYADSWSGFILEKES